VFAAGVVDSDGGFVIEQEFIELIGDLSEGQSIRRHVKLRKIRRLRRRVRIEAAAQSSSFRRLAGGLM
jgi:hypothetical protein